MLEKILLYCTPFTNERFNYSFFLIASVIMGRTKLRKKDATKRTNVMQGKSYENFFSAIVLK